MSRSNVIAISAENTDFTRILAEAIQCGDFFEFRVAARGCIRPEADGYSTRVVDRKEQQNEIERRDKYLLQ
jgi:hypothetical protein